MTVLRESETQSDSENSLSPKVKICGIMAPADAEAAAAHGADFLGLNFVTGRRRCLTLDKARDIIQSLGSACPPTVGLFLDEKPTVVRDIVAAIGLQYVQFCGQESPAYCAEVGVPYWKVINLHSVGDFERLNRYVDATAFLLEGADNGPGGTGQTWDWGLASAAPRDRPTLIAGGLNPENVGEAIARAQPWGVDVSSGVETNGAKDPDRIAAFIHQARDASLP
ncbi:MAG: phosphoribosylanthranilate isomerase [Chloroflexi bacterium]|nr:phosphoribosylanthranilate isomerase [Chloroflexota bacterium]